MAEGISRTFVVNRAFVADRWLSATFGVSIQQADEQQLTLFLETVPPDLRVVTRDALIAYGDDLVRKGRAPRNVARGMRQARD